MKIAWIHSFNREANANSGIFMFQLMEQFKNEEEFEIVEFYTGKISLRTLFPIIKRLRKETKGFDIVHAQYGSGCGLVTAFLKGRRILSLRGSDWYVSKKSNTFKEYIHTRLSVFMTKISLFRYHSVITMSNRMTNELTHSYPSFNGRSHSIMDGIDLVKFAPMNRAEQRMKLFGVEDSSPWVLFSSVADNNPLKRHYMAKKAFDIANESIPELKMKFMNGIPHKDVPAFISCCDVIILTSTHEGWPNIIKEGMALNVPFVSTDVSDLKEIALKEESCTVVEEINDEEMMSTNLAEGIIKATRINTGTLRNYTEEMTIDKIVEKIKSVYL